MSLLKKWHGAQLAMPPAPFTLKSGDRYSYIVAGGGGGETGRTEPNQTHKLS